MNFNQTPVLVLRDAVLFPGTMTSVAVNREKSLNALKRAQGGEGLVLAVAQKDPAQEEIDTSELTRVGTLCQVLQVIQPVAAVPGAPHKVLLRSLERGKVLMYFETEDLVQAQVVPCAPGAMDQVEMTARRRALKDLFEEYRQYNEFFPEGLLERAEGLSDDGFVDFLAAHANVTQERRIAMLEQEDPSERAKLLYTALSEELFYLRTNKELRDKVEASFSMKQKEQYLREQMRAIQTELGGDEDLELVEEAQAAGMPQDVLEKTLKEIDRLGTMSDFSPEATVCRSWIDWVISLPWDEGTLDNTSLAQAREVLDASHWGLEKVKSRLIEFLAQKALAGEDCPAQILCLAGPPGVGKTSLGRQVAQALGRKFVSFSMGGMRDESEIRGHRRTYIGSRPGRIIQKLREAGTKNPVMLLDEVDKLGSDFRGDPASALLEALDPEQNSHFTDHYLEVPFDLSDVLFITTANVTHTIPKPLLDRMEVIQLSGYLPEEKIRIAQEHLLPRLYKEHGLTKKDLKITPGALEDVIRHYTRESGVRQLKRQLGKIFRHRAVETLTSLQEKGVRLPVKTVGKKDLVSLLGAPRHMDSGLPHRPVVGYSTGLAWTETGGEALPIEVMVVKGKGSLLLTGNLGDVMKESAQAALSYLRAHWSKVTKKKEPDWNGLELHLHAPEGAIPKDGPSAGLAIATAMLSALAGLPYDPTVAMTGEINLHGEALPIGGLKEKLLAARRYGVKKVLIPKANAADLAEIEDWMLQGLDVETVTEVTAVFDRCLGTKR